MKKILSIIALVALQGIFIYDLRGSFTEQKDKEMHPFELSFTDGRTSRFTKDNFPEDLILYYFTPDCKLCFSEVSEIIAYSKKRNVHLLFVTSSELKKTRGFALELQHRGISPDETGNLIAQIKEEEVTRVFGEIVAPQCVLFGKGLEVKGVREGIITDHFLAEAFK